MAAAVNYLSFALFPILMLTEMLGPLFTAKEQGTHKELLARVVSITGYTRVSSGWGLAEGNKTCKMES